MLLVSVEALDRVMQSSFRLTTRMSRERIVDSRGPTLFFEHSEYDLLIGRRPFKLFDDVVSGMQLTPTGVPLWFDGHAWLLQQIRQNPLGAAGFITGRLNNRLTFPLACRMGAAG